MAGGAREFVICAILEVTQSHDISGMGWRYSDSQRVFGRRRDGFSVGSAIKETQQGRLGGAGAATHLATIS